jgi:hypothetical protein
MKELDKIKLVVDGKKATVPFNLLKINDVDDSMRKIGYETAYWGRLLAKAEREHSLCEIQYRNWRAKETEKLISENNKLAEWKVKTIVESGELFVKFKEAIVNAKFNVNVLERFFQALNNNAFILPSKGKREYENSKNYDIATKGEK